WPEPTGQASNSTITPRPAPPTRRHHHRHGRRHPRRGRGRQRRRRQRHRRGPSRRCRRGAVRTIDDVTRLSATTPPTPTMPCRGSSGTPPRVLDVGGKVGGTRPATSNTTSQGRPAPGTAWLENLLQTRGDREGDLPLGHVQLRSPPTPPSSTLRGTR